eukprot:TRINITY_DN551_c0_g1_i6.p1 TRINITY_DN551_c0_g1~~TRINITY_DN551_c0_g1_i6.p1  ORF type:complete len:627 (-),score=79.96 TRINITY_DN551_c0_g1_i6:160-2013(-)
MAQASKADRADPVATDSANLTDFVVQMKGILDEMMNDLMNSTNLANRACQAAYDNISACGVGVNSSTVFYPPGFNGDFNSYKTNHSSCRSEQSQVQLRASRCEATRDAYITLENEYLAAFRALNEYNSPQECASAETDVQTYLQSMVTHFQNTRIAWWEAYHRLQNVTTNISNMDCTVDTLAQVSKKSQCDQHQLTYENLVCSVYQTTNESCQTYVNCNDNAWNHYVTMVHNTNNTVVDNQWEYRAIKRLQCLLDAFAATDMDAAIDACIQARYDPSSVSSACVSSYNPNGKPTPPQPAVCQAGLSVPNPNTDQFAATEYAGLAASPSLCYATCCTQSMYTFTTHSGWAPASYDSSTSYSSISDARSACESLTPSACYGVFDISCDGATAAQPAYLITPGTVLQASSSGSCVLVMRLATERNTTVTTTLPAVNCTWDVTFNRTDVTGVGTARITQSTVDEAFRFTTCSNETAEGQSCASQGYANGAWVMSNRAGRIVADGSCCSSTKFNRVVGQTLYGCNGYLNTWNKSQNRYFSVDKTIRGLRYSTVVEAKRHCLSLGSLCWGLMDDGCDGSGFALVDGIGVTTANWDSEVLVSSQGTCIYEKKPDATAVQTTGSN